MFCSHIKKGFAYKYKRQIAMENSCGKFSRQIATANPCGKFSRQIATTNSCGKFPRQILEYLKQRWCGVSSVWESFTREGKKKTNNKAKVY